MSIGRLNTKPIEPTNSMAKLVTKPIQGSIHLKLGQTNKFLKHLSISLFWVGALAPNDNNQLPPTDSVISVYLLAQLPIVSLCYVHGQYDVGIF